MSIINYSELSNSELKLEQKKLSDKYDVLKNEIAKLYQEMEKLDKEYMKIESEIKLRKTIIF